MVYFVRHGQSEDNVAPVFQTVESPLSKQGRAQAAQLAQRVRDLSFECLVSSPQPRALQTAETIAEITHHSIETSNLFVERIKPTSIDGKSWYDETASATWRKWEQSFAASGPQVEDGETATHIITRADNALEFLLAKEAENIVAVSHAHFIRTIIARVLLGDALTADILKRFYELVAVENTGITVLQYSNAFEEDYRWRVWSLNDHAHFKG